MSSLAFLPNTNCMFKLTNTSGRVQGTCTVSSVLFSRLSHIAIFILCCLPGLSRAQSGTWIDVQEYDFDIHLPNGTFDTGDTVYAEIHLDSPSNGSQIFRGVDINLELSGDAALPSQFDADFAGGWLLDSTDVDSSTEVRPLTRLMEVYAERLDGVGQSGAGLVLKVPIVCDADNVQASDLVVDGGGLVLVDNVDMKTAGPQGGAVHTTVTRLDAERGPTMVSEATGTVDLAALPPGLYFIVETDAAGHRQVRKILKE